MSGPKCKQLIFSVLPILNIDATYRHEYLYCGGCHYHWVSQETT